MNNVKILNLFVAHTCIILILAHMLSIQCILKHTQKNPLQNLLFHVTWACLHFLMSQIFTGDTLFIGSCGRPDLVGSLGHTSQDMAGMMFDSLQNKLMTLPLEVQVGVLWLCCGCDWGVSCGDMVGVCLV